MEEVKSKYRDFVFAEEALVVDAQLFLHNLMEEKEMSRADLAKAMGVSRARITQIFSDDCKNFTIRLFARAASALNERVELDCEHFKNSRRKREYKSLKGPACGNVVHLWEEMILPQDSQSSSPKMDHFIDYSVNNSPSPKRVYG